MNRLKSAAAFALLCALIAGCAGGGASTLPTGAGASALTRSKLHPTDTLGGVGNLKVLLTDAPPEIGGMTASAIDLGIDSIAVINNGTVTTLASYSTPYVVNVMETPDDPTPIAIGQFYQGSYQALRFTIDVASSNVIANGHTFPIQFLTNTATESTTGAGMTTSTTGNATTVSMVVQGNFTVNGGPAQAVQADFNALESLALGANGGIVARPTLFAVANELAGRADGTVENASGVPVVGATVAAIDENGDVANTTSTDSYGDFDLHTIAAGMYHLVVYNTYRTASGQVLNADGNGSSAASVAGPSVTVSPGQITQVGTIAD